VKSAGTLVKRVDTHSFEKQIQN